MKLFKIADLSISLCLIIGFGIGCIYDTGLLFYGFLITGGWQLVSIIVHLVNGWFRPKENLRTFFYWLVLGIILLGVITTSLTSSVLLFYYLMIPVAPVLLISYAYICYDEIRILRTRPLALYK